MILVDDAKSVTLTSGKWSVCATLTLPPGLWIVLGKGDFVSNATGCRCISFNPTGQELGSREGFETHPAVSGYETNISLPYIVNTNSDEEINLSAMQNSGGTLNVFPRIRAVKIK